MKTIMSTLLTAVLAFAASSNSFAEETETKPLGQGVKNIYVGAGFSYNTIDSAFDGPSYDSNGLQGFLGFDLGMRRAGFETNIEAGYSVSGDFDIVPNGKDSANGIWISAAGLKSLPEISPNLKALVSLGVDLGDDDGLFMGFGAEYSFMKDLSLRMQFLNKDIINSYQASITYRLP